MIAVVMVVVLAAIGAVHILWGARIWWPVGDEARLTAIVLGAKGAVRMPSALACYAVALMMALCAIWVMMLAQWIVVLPDWLIQIGGVGMAMMFFIRGAAAYTPAFAQITPQPQFRQMDRRIYGPLCLVLGGAVVTLLI